VDFDLNLDDLVHGTSTSPDLAIAGGQHQSEKSTDFMVVKKKDGYKKKFIIKNSADQVEEPTLALELDGILNQTRINHERQKRQSDATTEVVGLRLNQAAMNGGEYNTLKRGARSVNNRAKRSINFSFSKFFDVTPKNFFRTRRRLQVPKYGPPGYTAPPVVYSSAPIHTAPPIVYSAQHVHTAPPVVYTSPAVWLLRNFVTMTQRLFNAINYNYDLARRFLLSLPIQSSSILPRVVVTNPRGVTCADVCDPEGGVGYGTIGICTEKFCKCDFSTWQFTRYDCPRDCVFDPLRLVCDYPQNTILCSDDDDADDNIDDDGFNSYNNDWQGQGGYGGYSK
ncbi:unnamed protein product, partial [Allacma fusca]